VSASFHAISRVDIQARPARLDCGSDGAASVKRKGWSLTVRDGSWLAQYPKPAGRVTFSAFLLGQSVCLQELRVLCMNAAVVSHWSKVSRRKAANWPALIWDATFLTKVISVV
jgi:hypothetical protein